LTRTPRQISRIFSVNHFQPERDDRACLKALLSALDASEAILQRDPPIRDQDNTGDWAIYGSHGHIYPDGDGYLLYAHATPRRWTSIKQSPFCKLTQDGDDEGCLHLDRLPTAVEAVAIRDAIGIRKRRSMSADQIERARSLLASARTLVNRPFYAPGSAEGGLGATMRAVPISCA
jgi:hypothetical protein